VPLQRSNPVFTWLASLAAPLMLGVLGGCSITTKQTYETVTLQRTSAELPTTELLDVAVVVFDPGLPEGGVSDESKLIFSEVRQAEARFMPYHLKTTLEASGQWGSVWVVPERSEAVDLTVWARVDRSDGLNAALRVGAWDATGREWLNKTYRTLVPEKAYSKLRDPTQDPYQNVYNEISNDLLAVRRRLGGKELERIRTTAELRYAADLVPVAFGDFISREKNGTWQVRRLPAADDPMVARLQAVREREFTLYDTLNEFYANLYYQLQSPYAEWRKLSREEMLRYQDLRRSAFIRGAAGVAAIMAAVLYESGSGNNSAITMAGVFGGIEGIKSGLGKLGEAGASREALKELGTSFNTEAEPVVVEVEGQTRRLQGTAEEKYREWRRLLREIYTAETGLAADPLPTPPAAASGGPKAAGS
jgi:hypothetical protein